MSRRIALAALIALAGLGISPTVAQETPKVRISEVLANSGNGAQDASFEWFEIQNPSDAPILLAGWSVADNSASDPLPEIVIAPGGFVLVVASERALPDAPEAARIVIADGRIGNGLANSGDRLLLLDPSGTTIDGVSWGSDRTLSNLSPPPVGQSLMRDLQSLMFAAGTPTPGTGPPAPLPRGAVPPLVITEIFANAGQGQRDAAFEWVEIFNPTNARVDLDGWLIADNAASDALRGGIPAMSYVVIIASPDAIDDVFNTITIADGRIGNGLANDGDTVTLRDPAGQVVDRVDFSGPPLPRPERDRSIALIDSGWILNVAPTPGVAGATPLLASLAGANDLNPPDLDRASPPARVLPEEGGGLSGGAFVLIALMLPLTVVAGHFMYRRWRPRSNDP